MASLDLRRSSRLQTKREHGEEQVEQIGSSLRSGLSHKNKKRGIITSSSSSESELEFKKRTAAREEDPDDSEDSDVLVVTPKKTPVRKTNDFFKVHSSYNRDNGLDLYEGEFIDDTDIRTDRSNYAPRTRRTIPLKKRKQRRRKSDNSSVNSDSDVSSSSDIGQWSKTLSGKRKRATVQDISSEESCSDTNNHGNGQTESTAESEVAKFEQENEDGNTKQTKISPIQTNHSDSDESLKVKRLQRKGRAKLDSFLSDSSEEELKNDMKTKRRRRLKRPDSDDEISTPVTPVRLTSSRAEKLHHIKMMKADNLLRNLKRARTQNEQGQSDEETVDQHGTELTHTSKPDVFVSLFEPSADPKTERRSSENRSSEQTSSLAERILFPVESDESSAEESDWIVSDDDTDVMAVVDYDEIIKGAYSSIAKRGRLSVSPIHESLGVGCEGGGDMECVEWEDGEGVVSVTCEDKLLQAVTSEDSFDKLTNILPEAKSYINTAKAEGRTPLMLSALKGDSKSMKLLLEYGADITCQDSSRTTPLHLAALSGCIDCVNMLIAHGHLIECRDAKGWSPLLYAHFGDHQECVLALMKASPQQLSVLSDLLKRAPEEGTEARRKTVKVVRSLLVSLAHHETYYSLFNSFIRDNLSVLDEDGFGFMRHCMALLSFENKQEWLKTKLRKLKEYANMTLDGSSYSEWRGVSLSAVPRDRILETVRERLSKVVDTPERCWLKSLFVTFRGEPGICTGPRKEFWSCLSKAVANDEKMFKQTDGGHLSLQPCTLFSKYSQSVVTPTLCQQHKQLLHLIGVMVAFAVFHGDTIDISLSNPLLKKLVGLSLSHPGDLEDVDHTLYHTVTTCLEEEGINDLELTFTTTLLCPWSATTVDVPITEGGRSLMVTDENKEDYVHHLSKFKLDTSIQEEVDCFLSGFWKVIPLRCLEVFKPNELSLLISGVPTINVDDWCKHTQYHGLKFSDDSIVWFWKLVRSLKEEEKALLLKFSTGSPRVPAGGFSHLLGLGGPTLFKIMLVPGMDKIPQASTCFNALKLSDYSCEQELRNKVLIAIRYGCEGFEFS